MVKIIDFSVKLEDFMPSHKNLQRPFVKPHVTHEESKSRKLGTPEDPMTFTTTFMAMVDHTGTHVDAFYHNNPDGLPVDEMPLEMFMGKAVALGGSGTSDRSAGRSTGPRRRGASSPGPRASGWRRR
jgi:kynurenine formamidase